MKEAPENINPFKTPENYFENFSEEMQIRISEENLKDKFGNSIPFKVPENYFENSKKMFIERIKETNRIKKNPILLLKPYLSIAAGLLVVLAVWQLVLSNFNFNNSTLSNTNTIEINNEKDNSQTAKIYEDEIILYTEEATILEVVNETPEIENDTLNNDETIDYLADYIDYSDLLAMY